MPTLADAISDLVEANAALRKRRALAKPELALDVAMRKAFNAEARAFLKLFARLKPYFPKEVREAVSVADWLTLFGEATRATEPAFAEPIQLAAVRALEQGIAAAVADLAITDRIFTLEHPEAVRYLRVRGLTQVARIRETTRETLRRILAQAADEGWSYDRTAKAIRERYKHFSKERARNIAVFELGDAYEHGNMLVARDLQAGGLEMEKQWLSVGDTNVRPDHRANQGQGWIPLDDAFQNGSERPPTDPRCRCTLLLRRKPSE